MKLSLIILIFNGASYLPELITSLKKTKWPTQDFEIFFVDNASSDNSVEIVRNCSLTAVHIICNSKNLGFTGGNNIGIQKALESKSDYIVLLNQDTVVDPEWLEELVRVAKDKPDAGAVQPLLLYWSNKNVVNSWGNHVHFLGFEFAGGNLEKLPAPGYRLQTKEVTYCSGAAVLYKSSVLKKVGLFDETLESYHEDADICLRMRLRGYKSYLAPQSIVYHKYEFIKTNKGKKGQYKYYLMERNRLYTLLKFYQLKTLMLIFPAWFVMEAGLMLFAITRGFWPDKLRGYAWLIKNFQLVLERRNEIQSMRSMEDKELTRDFVAVIDYQEINNPLLQRIGNPIMERYWKVVKKII